MDKPAQTYVVGEEGGSTRLLKDDEFSRIGAAKRLANQNRRGYIVSVKGDPATGEFTLLQAVNEPSIDYEEVAQRFRLKNTKTGGSSNSSMFTRRHI